MTLRNAPLLAALALPLLLAGNTADAAVKNRVVTSHAVGNCQPATKVADGSIRKRALAVVNEGDTTGFVTCAFASPIPNVDESVSLLRMFVGNQSNVTKSMTCTLVGGIDGALDNQFQGNNLGVAPNVRTEFEWPASVFNNGKFPSVFSVSCALEPGMKILVSYLFFSEDVGT